MLRKMKAKPIVFNWVSTNKDQEVTRCSLPWEVSLYRSLQQKLDKPCETLDQYKAKVVGMEAYIYQFLNPISSDYLSCPGTIHIYFFSTDKDTRCTSFDAPKNIISVHFYSSL